jgi:2-alkenal reductase
MPAAQGERNIDRGAHGKGSRVMNIPRSAFAVALSAPLLSGWPELPAAQQAERLGLLDIERRTIAIFERAAPSVVQIAGRRTGDNQAFENRIQGGSGFIWDTRGHVVTNDHVVRGTSVIAIRLSTGEAVRAQVIGLAPTYDIAVLRLVNPREIPPPLPVGTSFDLKVGQLTFAIGTPYGLEQSLTTGVVSALKRRLPIARGRELTNVIQTDAAINPGSSGGPLLDSSGRLIGVNTAIYSPSGASAGVGFAIPVDVVSRVVPELIRHGRVPMPGIGLIPAAESVATRLGVKGIVVWRIVPNSPAARAGLKGVNAEAGTIGDVIVSIAGKPALRVTDYTEELERVGVGGKIEITYRRDGKEYSVAVPVVDTPRSPPQR